MMSQIEGQMSIFDFLASSFTEENKPVVPHTIFSNVEISDILKYGSNSSHSRERIISQFERKKSISEIANMLCKEFHGGYGICGPNGEYAAWYTVDGIHLAKGKSAKGKVQVITWDDAAGRIRDMLDNGTFASDMELAEADGFVRTELAQRILYLYHDLSEEAKKNHFHSLSQLPVGYPDATAALSGKLEIPAFVDELRNEFIDFREAYGYDRSLLRFHYHKLYKIQEDMEDLLLPRREYVFGLEQMPEVHAFITEDEINSMLGIGSLFVGGKKRIYGYFSEDHDLKEKSDFLKKEYGIGGHSHALSGSDQSNEFHDSKGIRLSKANCPEIRVTWPEAAKRIEKLINEEIYL